MKVLLVCEFFPTSEAGDFTGGVEASTFFLARELANKHQITILCSSIEKSRSKQRLGKFTVIRVGQRRKYTSGIDITRIFFILAAINAGRQIKADIVVGTNFVTHLIAYHIGRAQEIPIIYWVPDVWQGEWLEKMPNLVSLTGELIEKYNLSRRGVYFIAISRTVAAKLRKAGVAKNLIKVIPCGVNLSLINKIRVKRNKWPVLCLISRLVGYKKIDVLLKSLPIITRGFPSVKLKLIGQGPERQRLQLMTKKMGIEDKVKFLGFIPSYGRLIAELKSSHVVVHPSTTEGFGIVVLEAMAAGIPVVLADTKVSREITGGHGGLFFKKNNCRSLAKQVIILLSDKKVYDIKAEEGKDWASKFSWTDIARRTETFYQTVINEQQQRGF